MTFSLRRSAPWDLQLGSDDLEDAIEGESYETETMYRDFAQQGKQAEEHGAVGADDVFLADVPEVGGDEVDNGRGGCAGLPRQGGSGEVLGGGEGAVPLSEEDGDLLGIGDRDDVELSISIDVIDDRGDRSGSGGWVRDGSLKRAVGVAEQDGDGAAGGEGAVGNDQVAVAVPVQVCRSKNAGGGEGVGGYGEALCTGHDVQAVTQ